MNAGVRTTPWGVVISPVRAAPLVAERRNEKPSDMRARSTKQQTGVAIGVEPIAAFDGVRIGTPHHIGSRRTPRNHFERAAAHSSRESRAGHIALPHVVRPYSTFGGTCG